MLLKSQRLAILATTLAALSFSLLASGSEAKFFQTLKWETVDSIADIDTKALAALQSRMLDDSRISDPGGPFNAGDVVTGEPTRRLLIAGRFATRWFVAYERGGRGHHIVLVVLKRASAGFEPVFLARGTVGKPGGHPGWNVGVSELRAALTYGTMREDDVRETSYL